MNDISDTLRQLADDLEAERVGKYWEGPMKEPMTTVQVLQEINLWNHSDYRRLEDEQ